jgi:uncharacterized protein (DUF1800 family)
MQDERDPMSRQQPLLKFEDFRNDLDEFLKRFGAGGRNANDDDDDNRYDEDDDPYTGRRSGRRTIPTGSAAALHVARRLTFGATPALVAEIDSKGIQNWIDEQLAWQSIDDSAMEPILANFAGIEDSYVTLKTATYRTSVTSNLQSAAMARAVWSRRQLYELMVDLWTNHFNVDASATSVQSYKPMDDLDVIRANPLGKFSDLLLAATKSPAMLAFLNNAQSRADGSHTPNENHARELMELHTVGAANGYSEEDVAKVAHLLSGWVITKAGTFMFANSRHDLGPAADGSPIVGWSRNGRTGVAAGESFVQHLARHPDTAQSIAFKLCVRFIGDYVSPSDEIVTTVAAAYMANDTAIAPTLRTLFQSSDFKASAGLKARRPFEFIAGTLRAVGATFDATQLLAFQSMVNGRMKTLGQPLFSWSFPNGYADADCTWITAGSMLERWNFARQVAIDGLASSMIDITAILGTPAPVRVGDVIRTLANAILSEPLDEKVFEHILDATDLDSDMRWQSWYDAGPLLTYILQSPQNQIR